MGTVSEALVSKYGMDPRESQGVADETPPPPLADTPAPGHGPATQAPTMPPHDTGTADHQADKDQTHTHQATHQAPAVPRDQWQTWKDCQSVSRLSAFIKSHKDDGVTLCQSDGKIILHFDPGLDHREYKRWQMGKDCLYLLQEAKDDLKYLLNKGMLRLVDHGSYPG